MEGSERSQGLLGPRGMPSAQSLSSVIIHTVLTHRDLLKSDVGQRHPGGVLPPVPQVRAASRSCAPRALVRGLYMLIEATN